VEKLHIPADLDSWTGDLLTPAGMRFSVRPARPEDAGALSDFFGQLTQDDLRFRFLTGVGEVSSARLAEMTRLDHELVEHFLAYVPGDDMIIASGMLAIDSPGKRGEIAIATRGDYRRRGVARRLVEHLVEFARFRGLTLVESIASRENHALVELEQRLGFKARPVSDDPSLVLLQCRIG